MKTPRSPDILRALFLIVLLPWAALAEPPFDAPYASPSGAYSARFSLTRDSTNESSGTTLKITDRAGRIVFTHSILDDSAQSACWTDDSRFLIIPTINGGGHSPWHFHIYVFSVAHRAVRRLDDSRGPPIISSEVKCRKRDNIILVGQDFSHGIAAPDDPILLHYKVDELWKKLR